MRWSTLGLAGAGLFGAVNVNAGESVALYLKVNGADVRGESTVTSMGRDGSIQCLQVDFGVRGTAEARRYDTIRCTKRIDKSSPLLMKALIQGQTTDATFKFFRPNPTGDGTTEQFYTVVIKGGRIDGIKAGTANQLDPAKSSQPPTEEVSFTFRSIAFTYTNGGIFVEDGAIPGVR